MKLKTAQQKAAKPGKVWQPIQFLDLISYDPSGIFFARLRMAGKLIRQSLKTYVLSIANLRLADFEKNELEREETRTQMLRGWLGDFTHNENS